MDREWHRPDIDVRSSEIHTMITQGNFSRIYTTNYDRWLKRRTMRTVFLITK